MNKLFTAEYTNEALEQAEKLEERQRLKLYKAVGTFEQVGAQYKNLNNLGNGLYELKPDKVRAYFKYHQNRVIIIGLVVLKKSQKAPKYFIEQADKNIERYLQERHCK